MISPGQGLAFGAVQGLTEFLPISSSAHLILLPWLFGWDDPGLGFDVALHVGTLLAVLWYFWRDWLVLVTGVLVSLRKTSLAANPDARLFWRLVAASVPGAAAGLLFEHAAEETLRAPLLIAMTLPALGALLFYGDRMPQSRRGLETIGWRDALLIGAAQAAAIVPGVSRSGVTITAARFLSIDRESAARFSFLLSTPIIAGAALVKVKALVSTTGRPSELLGLVAAAAFGFAAIAGLIRYVRTQSYTPFVVYRFVLAGAVAWIALR